MSSKKTAPRRSKKGSDVTNEFVESYNKNFNCSDLKLKKPFPFTDNHTKFYYTINNLNTNMVFLDGVAGSMKTYIAVYAALEHLRDRYVDQIIYVRTVVESASRSLGFLPGELSDKFEQYSIPFTQKALEIIQKADLATLVEREYIKPVPVNFARGQTFNNSFVIIDEAQNATRSEISTLLSRVGRNTKYVIIGDTKQSDIKDSGFKQVFDLFDTEFSRKNNIHCMKFDASDIRRSEILKHIAQVLGI